MSGKSHLSSAAITNEYGKLVAAFTTALGSELPADQLSEQSRINGNAYSISNVTYDPAAADTVVLIKNTDSSLDFYVEDITISTDVTTEVIIHVPTSEVASPTGTTITPRNLNTSSSNTADMTAIGDETTNSQGDIMAHFQVIGGAVPYTYSFGGSLILTDTESMGVDLVADVAAVYITITGYFA